MRTVCKLSCRFVKEFELQQEALALQMGVNQVRESCRDGEEEGGGGKSRNFAMMTTRAGISVLRNASCFPTTDCSQVIRNVNKYLGFTEDDKDKVREKKRKKTRKFSSKFA